MRRAAVAILVASIVGACTGAPSPAPTAPPTIAATATTVPTPAPTPTPTPAATQVDISETTRLTIWRAMRDTLDTGTARIELTGAFEGVPSVPDGLAFTMSGSTSFSYPAEMAFEADFSGLGLGTISLISKGDLFYGKGAFLDDLGVKSGKWLVVDLASDDPEVAVFADLRGGQNDASIALYYLFGLQLPIERMAAGQRFGLTTQAYAGEVRLTSAIAHLGEPIGEEQGRAILKNILGIQKDLRGDVTAEVWIADGMIREVTYEFGLGYTEAGGVLRVTYAFDAFGEPLDLGIPARKDRVAFEDLP